MTFSLRARTAALLTTLRRRAANTSGVAAVEFALILPLMLIIYLGSSEITEALMASRSSTLVARTLADLVSQQANGVPLTDAQLAQVFTAADAIMAPFSASTLKMTVTSVDFVANSSSATSFDAKPRWTAVKNGGAPRPCSKLTPVANTATPLATTLPTGVYGQGSLIVADISYTYTPPFGANFFGQHGMPRIMTYSHTAYMRPRSWTEPTNYISYSGSSAKICASY